MLSLGGVSSRFIYFMRAPAVYFLREILSRMNEKRRVTRPATIPTSIIGFRYSMKFILNIYVSIMLLGLPVSRAAENVFAEANSHIR